MNIWELIGGYFALSIGCCAVLVVLAAKEARMTGLYSPLPPLARRRGAGNARRSRTPVASRYVNRHRLRVTARRA
jgi:hypothetical protein